MRTGIFGGTFDPPHLGHVTMARKAVLAAGLDRLIIMPDRIPPHKQVAGDFTPGALRLRMCELAFGEIEGALVSDWELRQEGKSYSVLTLRHLREELPEDELWFVMGSDMLTSFRRWYRYEELLTLCGLVCVSREKGDRELLEEYAQGLRDEGGRVIIADAEPFELSSTQVREMLRRGEDCTGVLPEPVSHLITNNGLYKAPDI